MDKVIKSRADLDAIRSQAKADLDLRAGDKDMRVVVHMGTCGIAAGARDVLGLVMAELEKAKLENVTVRLSGCMGLCDQEPMFTLTDRTGKEFCYTRLSPAKVHEIVHRHIMGDEPVTEFLVSG